MLSFCMLVCILSAGCEKESGETGGDWAETAYAGMSAAEKRWRSSLGSVSLGTEGILRLAVGAEKRNAHRATCAVQV